MFVSRGLTGEVLLGGALDRPAVRVPKDEDQLGVERADAKPSPVSKKRQSASSSARCVRRNKQPRSVAPCESLSFQRRSLVLSDGRVSLID